MLRIGFWFCASFIIVCIIALAVLCVLTVDQAEVSSAELNAGSRRQYVEQRMTYFSDELLYSQKQQHSLAGGSLTWINSTELVRCLLRQVSPGAATGLRGDANRCNGRCIGRSSVCLFVCLFVCLSAQASYALLSVHYAVLYGGETGWVELPISQSWEYGAIGPWLQPAVSRPPPLRARACVRVRPQCRRVLLSVREASRSGGAARGGHSLAADVEHAACTTPCCNMQHAMQHARVASQCNAQIALYGAVRERPAAAALPAVAAWWLRGAAQLARRLLHAVHIQVRPRHVRQRC
jgi:hypothetical protein